VKIEQVETFPVSIPLKEPFETSFGRFTRRETLLVRVRAEGEESYSECPIFGPFYSYETPVTARHAIRDYIAPAIEGKDLKDADDFHRAVRLIRGHPMAKAAVEMALWDLWAREAEKPLFRLLGGAEPRVPAGISLGVMGSMSELLERVQQALEEGYHKVKIKIRPGWCVDVVEAVRERFPDIPLMVDANAGFDLEAKSELKALDRYELMMIEQPLPVDDLLGHAELQRSVKTPICLDESIHSPDEARTASRLGCARIVNIKPPRVGGLGPALQVYKACRQEGLGTWVGSMVETDLGRAYLLAFATLGHEFVPDLTPTGTYLEVGLINPPIVMDRDGFLNIPMRPGIGFEVDVSAIKGIKR